MGLTPDQQQELVVYGALLDGTETELECAKMKRRSYLKRKFRPVIAAKLGDYGDNITDTMRALVLGQAIQLGLVADQNVINAYKGHVEALISAYGGAEEILAVLNELIVAINDELVDGYYTACVAIDAAETVESVRMVDLPGEPATQLQ